jgi:hypothetical protein
MTFQKNGSSFIPLNGRHVVSFDTTPVSERHEAIRRDISNRLRKMCSNLSDEEFAALVEKMLQVQLAGERRFA